MSRLIWMAAALLLWAGTAWAGDLRMSGFAAAELRGFIEDPQFREQFDGAQPSLILNPEFRYRTEEGVHRFSFIPFLRLDARDDERTHLDLREAYWLYIGDDWEMLAGINKVFWGVTESRHLVDIINQTDLVEDIDEEDKLGQPMINLTTLRDWGSLSFSVLPGFRERTFPGEDGRLRTAIPVDDDAAQFESDLEEWHVDFAVRYSHFIGDWDLGLAYFYGTGREPRLVPSGDGGRLIPHYDLIHQIGLDVQYTKEAWLWKLEGIVREGQGHAFAATVGGFEYTLYQIFETDADLGLLFEYLYDGRGEAEAPVTPFDDDIFVGTRLALNDVQDTQALIGAILDRKDLSAAPSIEAERRIGENWKIELESRLFVNIDDDNPLSSFRDDSFITLRVSRFF